MNAIKVLERAIKTYGPKDQITVFLGEIEELRKALRENDLENIIEEIADVQICLAQRVMIAGIEPDFSKTPKISGPIDDIVSDIIINEARIVQGRKYNYLPLYTLEGWLRNKIASIGCENEVERIKKKKIERLWRRLINRRH